MTFSIGAEHAAAQLAATMAFADSDALPSKIQFFANADGTGVLLAEVTLARPCGTLESGVLTLHTSAPALVVATGIPRSGRWLTGGGLLVAQGSVTDEAHGGDFQIAGAATPSGDTSPTIYAGAALLLGVLTFN